MYGDISAKTAEMMRKPDVAEYFASLLKRFSPKSMAQAMAEVTVTCRFLENFSGDQVSCANTCWCSIVVDAAMQHLHVCGHALSGVHSSDPLAAAILAVLLLEP